MSSLLAPTDGSQATPSWLEWLLSNTQMGLLVLDAQARVVFANKWLLSRLDMALEPITGRPLVEVFPVLAGSHFERALKQSMITGFPSLLSHTLHSAPFPLFAPSSPRTQGELLRQSIQIVPMGPKDMAVAGQRFTLIQIADVSHNVMREGLLKAKVDEMSDMAHMDVLTGVGNRRAFDQTLAAEVRAAVRADKPLGLLMLDLDHFKLFNDKYGHPAADRCLQSIADLLRQICRRPRDLVARYGGEELAVILPETDLAGALRVANDILKALRALQIPHENSPLGPIVTLSVGVSVMAQGERISAATLLQQADVALYAAKHAGRNCVVQFDPRALPPIGVEPTQD